MAVCPNCAQGVPFWPFCLFWPNVESATYRFGVLRRSSNPFSYATRLFLRDPLSAEARALSDWRQPPGDLDPRPRGQTACQDSQPKTTRQTSRNKSQYPTK